MLEDTVKCQNSETRLSRSDSRDAWQHQLMCWEEDKLLERMLKIQGRKQTWNPRWFCWMECVPTLNAAYVIMSTYYPSANTAPLTTVEIILIIDWLIDYIDYLTIVNSTITWFFIIYITIRIMQSGWFWTVSHDGSVGASHSMIPLCVCRRVWKTNHSH